MTPAQKIFSELPGEWTLSRIYRGSYGDGRIEGSVTFTPQEDGSLLYWEKGILYQGDQSSEVKRSYVYRLDGDDTLVIYYNDPGRQDEVLHKLVFAEDANAFVSSHLHVCIDDKYNLTFRFGADKHIEMDYVVKGPSKDYTMHSTLALKL